MKKLTNFLKKVFKRRIYLTGNQKQRLTTLSEKEITQKVKIEEKKTKALKDKVDKKFKELMEYNSLSF